MNSRSTATWDISKMGLEPFLMLNILHFRGNSLSFRFPNTDTSLEKDLASHVQLLMSLISIDEMDFVSCHLRIWSPYVMLAMMSVYDYFLYDVYMYLGIYSTRGTSFFRSLRRIYCITRCFLIIPLCNWQTSSGIFNRLDWVLFYILRP